MYLSPSINEFTQRIFIWYTLSDACKDRHWRNNNEIDP